MSANAEGNDAVHGPSHVMVPLLVLYFFLVVLVGPNLAMKIGDGYATIGVFAIIALISLNLIHGALSASSFARLAKQYPGLRRENWITNVLVQDVAIPLAAVLLYFSLL